MPVRHSAQSDLADAAVMAHPDTLAYSLALIGANVVPPSSDLKSVEPAREISLIHTWDLEEYMPSALRFSLHRVQKSERPPPFGGGLSRNPGGDLLSQGGTPKYHRRGWA